MKKVFIVGGNGFARECYNHIITLKEYGKDVIFGGFLGHGGYGHTVDYKTYQHLYLGEISEHEFEPDEFCVIGAGYPELRKQIYSDLKQNGIKFFTLISHDATLYKYIEMGEANVIIGKSYISTNTKLGNGNVLNGDVIIGHDSIIGDFNFLGPRSQILGNATVGDENKIGTNAILLPHSKLGNSNNIAPLSVVYKGFKNNCYIQGNPALKIGENN